MRIVESLSEWITYCNCGLLIAHRSVDNDNVIACPNCQQPIKLTGTKLLISKIKDILETKRIKDDTNKTTEIN